MNKSTVWNVLNQNVPDLAEGLSFDDIMKICGIIDANSFRIDKHGTRGVFLATSMVSMAIPVVEFSNQGYKIRKIFAYESTYSKQIIEF